VASLIGADRVCLGSDHGAVRFDIPAFEDCTKFPVVTQALKDHGFSDTEVRNILGRNVLRLMERVIGSQMCNRPVQHAPASVPMFPEAPPRFSTKMTCPRPEPTLAATARPRVSTPPPAG
jgi:Membrane dipeptidase (Peptidase family M19)